VSRRLPVRLSVRSRAWLWAGAAALLVLVYLVLWTLYAMTHAADYPRFRQLGPGSSARQHQADFRLVSLVRAPELAADQGDSQLPSSGAVWVVATLEVVRQADDESFGCVTELLGPGGRVWEPATLSVVRSAPRFCSPDELRVGQPFTFEQVYEVPARYADQVYGVVLVNRGDAEPNEVLTPAR
jgi:hypothetical protein